MRIKVLSYNIHKGFNFNNREFVLGKIKSALRDLGPDIVFLQEVIGHHKSDTHRIEEWPTTAQFEYLADEVWSHYAYGKNAIYTEGNHGNAVLSKWPFVEWENIDISTNRLERRGILHGTIEIKGTGKLIHLICLHLNLTEAGRRVQINKLCERVKATVGESEPLLICGDFNDWQRKAHKSMTKELNLGELFMDLNGSHAKTFPSFFPMLPLDRIYYRGIRAIRAGSLTGKPWRDLSDHLALYGVFEFEC